MAAGKVSKLVVGVSSLKLNLRKTKEFFLYHLFIYLFWLGDYTWQVLKAYFWFCIQGSLQAELGDHRECQD